MRSVWITADVACYVPRSLQNYVMHVLLSGLRVFILFYFFIILFCVFFFSFSTDVDYDYVYTNRTWVFCMTIRSLP